MVLYTITKYLHVENYLISASQDAIISQGKGSLPQDLLKPLWCVVGGY